MRNILDTPDFDQPEEEEIKTNFQKSAFILLIITISLMGFLEYMMSIYEDFRPHNKLSSFISLAILLSLCFGIFSTILSIVYKEIKNFRFTISVIGFFIIILLAFA